MPVNIHGKDYLTVAERIDMFRKDHPDYGVHTDLISNADLVVVKATITNENGREIGSGYAEEVRGSTNINKTSAVENCETSAIGRALASCGYGGEQYASANEVSDAITQQSVQEALQRHIALGKALQENFESIAAIKMAIAENRLESAVEAFAEIPEEDKVALHVAPTKGGVWTVAEYKMFKSNEWSEARRSYFGLE